MQRGPRTWSASCNLWETMTTTTMTTTTFHRPRMALVAWMAALSGAVAQLVLLAQ
jgi:hypothetical protein